MDRDDIYFAIATVLALLAFFGIDWRRLRGIVTAPQSNWKTWALLVSVVGSLLLSAIGWYRQQQYQCVDPADLDASKLDIKSLERIEKKHYSNESVEVDGKYFEDCTFENVTFIFHGKRSAAFYHNSIFAGVKLLSDNASITAFTEFMLPFRMLGTDVQWGEDQNTHNVWLKKNFSGDWGYSGGPGVPAQIYPAPNQNPATPQPK